MTEIQGDSVCVCVYVWKSVRGVEETSRGRGLWCGGLL
jgi:hypothetical protein